MGQSNKPAQQSAPITVNLSGTGNYLVMDGTGSQHMQAKQDQKIDPETTSTVTVKK